ncbi:MAG: septum formation initiator family protein [Bacilli bacterium]|nr:septum formation initiator family protein [Bacilli bacterium]
MASKKRVVKKAKKQTFRFLIFGLACIFIIGGILTSFAKVWVQIYDKYKEKNELEEKILALKEEEEQLTVDVERLQDPEYVARYLREKYFYSKNGEYIIRIPEESKK